MAQWAMCQAFQWRHLPRPGGLLAQDDAFLHDAAVFSRRLEMLRRARDRNKKRRQEAQKALGLFKRFGRNKTDGV